MKKVLMVTTIGGFLPQFEWNDVKLLRNMGCSIDYASDFKNPIYRFDKDELESEGIKLHQIDIKKSPFRVVCNVRAVMELKAIIDREKITLIHCHNPMGGVTARIAAGLSRRKPYVIYTAHGLHFYKGAPLKNWLLYYPAERMLARLTDRIVTINEEDRIRALTLPLKHKGAVHRIHGVGVDRERFRPKPEIREAMRKSLDIPEDAFHIVTAAELNDNKNQACVIRAIGLIKRNSPELGNRIFYSLCGRGDKERDLKELIHSEGLDGQVRLLGYRNDMEDVLQSADCFAFPSKREGLGIAAVEALLCGVPLIVSDNRGTREYAANKTNALVCRSNSPESFARAISRLASDKTLRNRYADRCRESALPFTTEEVEKTMINVYESAFEDIRAGRNGGRKAVKI